MKLLVFAPIMLCVLLFPEVACAQIPNGPADYMNVEITGDLRTGLVAIGGETTGSDIVANGWRFELDYPTDEMATYADRLAQSKHAQVLGSFRLEKGVELPDRWVLDVKKIRPTPLGKKPTIRVAILGMFKADERINEKQYDTVATPDVRLATDLSVSLNPAGLKKMLNGRQVLLEGEIKTKVGNAPPELAVEFVWKDKKKPRLIDFTKEK